AVKCRGHDGKWLNPRKADLQHWRDLFAEKLREEGVDAEATPRFTRGVTRKAERSAVRHMARDDRAHPPRVPDVVSAKRKEIFKELMEEVKNGVTAPPKPWEEAIKSRQNNVRRAWLSAAQALEQTTADTHSADKELPEAIRRFVSAMPSIDTERHLMKRELIQALTQKPEKHLAASNAQAEIRDAEGERANGISDAEKSAKRRVESSSSPSYGQVGGKQPGRSRDQDLER
ncbi:MAG TPA: hypothetical protein VD772_08050, partial [Anseongella sp.]|nr:hypothetical protein [Anseongella sp.]